MSIKYIKRIISEFLSRRNFFGGLQWKFEPIIYSNIYFPPCDSRDIPSSARLVSRLSSGERWDTTSNRQWHRENKKKCLPSRACTGGGRPVQFRYRVSKRVSNNERIRLPGVCNRYSLLRVDVLSRYPPSEFIGISFNTFEKKFNEQASIYYRYHYTVKIFYWNFRHKMSEYFKKKLFLSLSEKLKENGLLNFFLKQMCVSWREQILTHLSAGYRIGGCKYI